MYVKLPSSQKFLSLQFSDFSIKKKTHSTQASHLSSIANLTDVSAFARIPITTPNAVFSPLITLKSAQSG